MSETEKYPITFYYTDNCERQTVEPIAEEAKLRGFPVKMSNDMNEKSVIGFYCQHNQRPKSGLSIIMLHDMAQRHDVWPNFWFHEPWNEFDIGILPGKMWVDRWKLMSKLRVSQPKIGVFDLGWPKADLIYKNMDEFATKTVKFKSELNLKYDKTILYAPSWENNGKQDEFVQSLMDLPVNLLLKQAPWPKNYAFVLENIRKMNELHRNIADNVHIIDPEISIMYCIGASDLLVSDESSVLLEAALYGIPSLAVSDWLIPDQNPPRLACVPFENINKTKLADLRQTCLDILTDKTQARSNALTIRDEHFSNLGNSSLAIMNLIEDLLISKKLSAKPI